MGLSLVAYRVRGRRNESINFGNITFGNCALGAGFISGLLNWLRVIKPVIGFFGADLGAGGLFMLLIKSREGRKVQ